jgi:hypothetical protein
LERSVRSRTSIVLERDHGVGFHCHVVEGRAADHPHAADQVPVLQVVEFKRRLADEQLDAAVKRLVDEEAQLLARLALPARRRPS